MARDVPPSESRPPPVGRPGAPLVADAVEGRPGGRVAGAAHGVRSGLLAQRGVAAVEPGLWPCAVRGGSSGARSAGYLDDQGREYPMLDSGALFSKASGDP